jgi:hypothetical protein
MYIADGSGTAWADFKGDTRVDAVFPNANGTNRDFTPSAGTDDFAVVDETDDNEDTDYLTATAAAQKCTMNFPNAPLTGADIYGLQVIVSGKKTDAGSSGHKAVARIGGTDYLGAERSLSTTYSFRRQPWDSKPSDSTPWTDTDFNAAEFGMQKSS